MEMDSGSFFLVKFLYSNGHKGERPENIPKNTPIEDIMNLLNPKKYQSLMADEASRSIVDKTIAFFRPLKGPL